MHRKPEMKDRKDLNGIFLASRWNKQTICFAVSTFAQSVPSQLIDQENQIGNENYYLLTI